MAEFEAGHSVYRSRLLCAVDQWHLLHRLKPILPALHGMDHGLRLVGADIGDVTKSLAPLLRAKDADMRVVFDLCLAACERTDEGVWRPVLAKPPLVELMTIVSTLVAENFGRLFAMERPDFKPSPYSGPQYAPVSMPNGEDWLFRPVLRGMCKAESLYDGTLRIEQIAKLNDALDVEAENQERMRAALDNTKPK